MSKHKSTTAIRLSEIGRCIRLLHEARRNTTQEPDVAKGFSRAITTLGEYKKRVRAEAARKEQDGTPTT